VMNSNRKSIECDYIVIGGGIVGGCISYYLSQNNKEVICIDSGAFSGSNSNAGSIHVQLQSRNFRLNPHLIDNLLENLPFYKEAVNAWDRLRLMLDVDFDLRVNGGLMVADNEEQLEFLYKKCQKEKAAGLDVEIMDSNKIKKIYPFLSNKVVGAEFCAHEGKLNPLVANKSLQEVSLRSGVKIMKCETVNHIEFKNNEYFIKTNLRDYFCETVIIAAGSGSGKLANFLNINIPTIAEPLHMNVTEKVSMFIPILIQHAERSITLKQISSGNIIIGGGWPARIEEGTNKIRIKKESLLGNLTTAVNLIPSIGKLRLYRTWGGINPITDGNSVLGNIKGHENVFFAIPGDAGYTLGPLCAEVIVDLINSKKNEFYSSKLSPERFLNNHKKMTIEN
jgi:glycine/D-amino acid oxidase-like deaminating enzyme